MSAAPELAGREALVHEVRRLSELMVAAEIDDAAAGRAAAALADLVDGLPFSSARPTPWFWHLPEDARDGSTGWRRDNPVAPPVRLRVAGQQLTGDLRFGMRFIGPPGRVHGGYLAAVLDHALGTFLSSIGRASFTLSLTTTYPAPTPLDADLELAAGHSLVEGRKTTAWAEIRHEGVTTSRAEGVFLTIGPASLAPLISDDEGVAR